VNFLLASAPSDLAWWLMPAGAAVGATTALLIRGRRTRRHARVEREPEARRTREPGG
jgi:hypothetical protein